MRHFKPKARFVIIDGWECKECGKVNSPSVSVCHGLACTDLRDDEERMRLQRIIDGAKYAKANGIKPPPPDDKSPWWRNLMPDE